MKLKWIYVEIKGWCGSAAVMIPHGITVSEFKMVIGVDPLSNVMVSTLFLPLPGGVRLYDLIDDFDTVYVEPQGVMER